MILTKIKSIFHKRCNEEIKRKLISLAAIAIVLLIAIITLDIYSNYCDEKSESEIYNQMAHRRLGRVIIRELITIEKNISKAIASEDSRMIDYYKNSVAQSISIINSALDTLQNGGTFTDILASNINDADSITEEYSYIKNEKSRYQIEIIDIRPKIIDIEMLAQSFFNEVHNHLSDANKAQDVDRSKLFTYSKGINTYIIRTSESATKIFYESHKDIQKLQEYNAQLTAKIRIIRIITFIFIIATGSFVFLKIYRQIDAIIKRRAEAENELRTEKDKLQSLIDGLASADIGISIVGINHEVYYQNIVLDEIFGNEKTHPCYQRFIEHNSPCNECPVKESVKTNKVCRIETTTSSGRILEILAAPIPNTDGTVDKAVEIARDITEQRENEIILQKNKQNLKSILNSVQAGIFVISQENHRIVFANNAAATMCQTTIDEMIDKVCYNYVCPNFKGNCPMSDINNKIENSERVLLTKSGEKLAILKTVMRIELNGEKCYLESFVDISKLKEAEAEQAKYTAELRCAKEAAEIMNKQLELATRNANEMARKAEIANHSKSEFLANMSHEIRTPMNSILGFSEMLMEADLNDEHLDIVRTINRSGNALLALINDILDLSKIEAGKMDMEIVDFDIIQMTKDVCEIITPKVKENVQLNCIIDDKMPQWVKGDPCRLRQVLINLLGNAAKFTENGKIEAEIKCIRKDDIEATVEIAIRDTGIGISQEQQKHIFDVFQQADGSTTRKYGGTGLGLAISKRIIKLMDAELLVESEEGKGSTFYFIIRLPLSSKGIQKTITTNNLPTDDNVNEIDFSHLHVLLVDDDEINLKLASKMLEKTRCKVAIANNGQEAVTKAQKESFNMILMDMQMPIMDGLEATTILRQKGVHTPIIALTANAFESDRSKCIEAGMNDFLSKPLKRELVLKSIKKWAQKEHVNAGA